METIYLDDFTKDGIVIEKLPSKSVIAPIVSEPLSWTVAPGKGDPFSSFTNPVIVLLWEKASKGNSKKIKIIFLIFIV